MLKTVVLIFITTYTQSNSFKIIKNIDDLYNQIKLILTGGTSMNFDRMIKDMGRMVAYIATGKREGEVESILFEEIGSTNLFEIMLKRYYFDGNYNKADDLIFEQLKTFYSAEALRIAIEFYELLLKKSDEHLIESNFTRQEILDSLEEINQFRKE